jgi:hypothetical protein
MFRAIFTSALLSAAMLTGGPVVQAASPPFGGAWAVQWCEPGGKPDTCGGFTAYLVQKGDRLCGTHYGSDERQNRMDEGEPRSITGVVVGSTAVLTIKSGRNQSIYLIRAVRKGNTIAWETLDTVAEGDNGEPAFVADKDVLKRDRSSQAAVVLKEAARQCESPSGRDGK